MKRGTKLLAGASLLLILNLTVVVAAAQRQRHPVRTETANDASSVALQRGISTLTQQISGSLTENRKRTIAVVEFANLKGEVTDVGRFVAEKLITQLYLTKKFKVIERQPHPDTLNECDQCNEGSDIGGFE